MKIPRSSSSLAGVKERALPHGRATAPPADAGGTDLRRRWRSAAARRFRRRAFAFAQTRAADCFVLAAVGAEMRLRPQRACAYSNRSTWPLWFRDGFADRREPLC